MATDVGIVMPVYKQKSSYLRTAIQSILNQSYRHFRLVIVMDGAPERMVKIVQQETRHDARVRVIILDENRGVAHALNRGFRHLMRKSEIRYLTWVSSDNIYYHNYLKSLRRALRRAPSRVGFVYSGFRHVDESGQLAYGEAFTSQHVNWMNQPQENLIDICFIGASFLYKRRYAKKIAGYTFEPVEDYEYWLRLSEQCEIQFVPKVLMDYRVSSPHSISKALLASKERQRTWRYAFELAKYEARQRRNIQPEITVIVPVTDVDDNVIDNLEALYSQIYSNFAIVIVDISRTGKAQASLQSVRDPRTSFVLVPDADMNGAVQVGYKHVHTPFVLRHDLSHKLTVAYIDTLVKHLRQANGAIISTHFMDEQTVQYDTELNADAPRDLYLYRAEILASLWT